MPFKSKAQSRKFFAMESRGEIPKGTAEEWASKTDYSKLPLHKRAHIEQLKKRKK